MDRSDGPQATDADRLRPPPAPRARDAALLAGQRRRRRRGCLLIVSALVLATLACPAGIVGGVLLSDRYSATPRQVKGLREVTAVAAGWEFSLALDKHGAVWAWGDNTSGQLGLGNTDARDTPAQIALPRPVTAIAAGGRSSYAVTDDGSVWAWGVNLIVRSSFVGSDGTCYFSPSLIRTPARVEGLPVITALAASDTHVLALTASGAVWAWGQVWGSSDSCDAKPWPGSVFDPPDGRVTVIAASNQHSLALTDDGAVWAWGKDDLGQLGDGHNGSGANTLPARVSGLGAAKAIAVGSVGSSMAVTTDGTVWFWGRGHWDRSCVGKFAVPSPRFPGHTEELAFPCSPVPVKAVDLPGATGVAMRTGVVRKSSLLWHDWCWDSGATDAGYPVATKSGNYYRDAAVLAIADDGQLWSWDNGRTGGANVVTARRVGLGDVRALATGRSHYLALRADGTVWAWGLNDKGQLGR